MPNRNIIVMGASAGGLSAFNRIIKHLPAQLNARGFHRLACFPLFDVDIT